MKHIRRLCAICRADVTRAVCWVEQRLGQVPRALEDAS
jgi:hypothetical protein